MSSDSSQTAEQQQQQPQQQQRRSSPTSSRDPSSASSPSSSISLVRVDELSSFGATKQNRLPALIQLQELPASSSSNHNNETPSTNKQLAAMDSPPQQTNNNSNSNSNNNNNNNNNGNNDRQQPSHSLPPMEGSQIESAPAVSGQRSTVVGASLPAEVRFAADATNDGHEKMSPAEKENLGEGQLGNSGDFQVVDMEQEDSLAPLMGPSLPAATINVTERLAALQASQTTAANNLNSNQPQSQLGESLIDMIINLRNENQNLVRALETNNDYVKDRIDEFKRIQEEGKQREKLYASEKAENEHQVRKLQRQNQVLSERLKTMETKLKDMKLEVSESLVAAHSSRASSVRAEETGDGSNFYPNLQDESFSNPAASAPEPATLLLDAASQELHNNGQLASSATTSSSSSSSTCSSSNRQQVPTLGPSAPPAATKEATKVPNMSPEELAKRFDAHKRDFYKMDAELDPLKQCDQLEAKLNEIGKRDYEICLLQQQLNIYRQDYRLERIAHLDAKVQIEKLKQDIERLCFERLQAKANEHSGNEAHTASAGIGALNTDPKYYLNKADAVVGRLNAHLGKRAARSAARAAKHASKQAYREEKIAAARAAAAAAAAGASSSVGPQEGHQQDESGQHGHYSRHHGHRRHHGSHALNGLRAVKNEVLNDLMSTANKAMLTGYKVASTHVNLAIDKLSQFEQSQANNLAKTQQQAYSASAAANSKASAPPAEPPLD